ncbi:uncharacterized protein LY89DRAFT_714473 [Mollisia scopiformis]|uniref:Fungal N-terminal domain-containing protein n=1 Tax=Mollisia scopiformis TaxID=149040 RepID=A0A194XR19_MOLSC|nr:uncharacterized protein LY89DRAFT_714473 [Mollisia scopiformis]KUJ22735.1 hypothetical protein LY89DRAFT_714473 [Mollisia scopiformis]
MVEPVSIISGTVSILNGTFTFGQWMYKISGVSAEVRKAVTDLANIQNDLNEARELRSLKFDMKSSERKYNRLYRQLQYAIKQLDNTVKECAKSLHNPDVDFETRGKVTTAHRIEWVLNGKDTYASRQNALIIDHNRLMKAISAVNALPDMSPSSPDLLAPPPYSAVSKSGDYWGSLSPSQRRAMRGKSTELIEDEDRGEQKNNAESQSSVPEQDSYSSSNSTISRKMRKLWGEGDSAFQLNTPLETIENSVEEEYVTSRHHRKRHRR